MPLMKVQYKGLSDIRLISKQDAEQHGVKLDQDLVWEPYNKHTVYVEGLSEELEKVLRTEGTFRVSEVDETSRAEIKEIIVGKPLDDTGAVVRDGTTGQVSENPAGKPANADVDPESTVPAGNKTTKK